MPNAARTISSTLVALACAGLFSTACTSDEVAPQRASLIALCVDAPETLPEDAWVCPDELVLECDGGYATTDTLYVSFSEGGLLCDGTTLAVSDEGPFPLGTHTISVQAPPSDAGVGGLCVAELTVVDTLPPVVRGGTMELWPPNHTMHTVTPDDCVEVTDRCDTDVELFFTYVESDEPPEARGDGNHEPDVAVNDCGSVDLRAERMGGSNGRVYRLGVRAVDDSGNTTDAECIVAVPHDQSGAAAIDDGVEYHVEMSEHC